jgi:hypothetical protein
MIKKFKDKLLEALFKGEKEATTKEQKNCRKGWNI